MKMDGYGTHQALLTAAMVRTEGPIVEMGGGWYSTPLVNVFSVSQKRPALTVETGAFVYDLLKRFQGATHTVSLLEGFDFDEVGIFKGRPEVPKEAYVGLQTAYLDSLRGGDFDRVSVAFVDQAPGFLRAPAIEYWADRAEFVITHDSEHVAHYGLEPLCSSFKSRWDFRLHEPNSVILSNTHDCTQFAYLDGRS